MLSLRSAKVRSNPNPKPAHTLKKSVHGDEEILRNVKAAYRAVQRACGGADTNICGVSGSMSPSSLGRVLSELDIVNNRLVDFGAGAGRVVLAASMCSPHTALGFDLPENTNLPYIFNSALTQLDLQQASQFQSINIMDLTPTHLGRAECAFSFWTGIPHEVQRKILSLCANTRSMKRLCVFKDYKWPTAASVLESLNADPTTRPYRLQLMLPLKMQSGETKTAFFVARGAPPPPPK
eukprot:NODE_1843_length_828_cov_22.449294_g1454_i0.p1 GENE.NODE_1843_length_828_cov_22.449294_g1454_i0~~NODE_1843_length_828_cov_22.449294_g1454_i0.p1  ORF type:complete len:262 (+),score=95.37 NODE_1843_length_828_cov_22.449294_g1454_i0:77-787(+)